MTAAHHYAEHIRSVVVLCIVPIRAKLGRISYAFSSLIRNSPELWAIDDAEFADHIEARIFF